jgi:hypothetical protein
VNPGASGGPVEALRGSVLEARPWAKRGAVERATQRRRTRPRGRMRARGRMMRRDA